MKTVLEGHTLPTFATYIANVFGGASVSHRLINVLHSFGEICVCFFKARSKGASLKISEKDRSLEKD